MTLIRRKPMLAARWIAVALIALVAFGLRVYDLGGRSLWYDEGLEYWAAATHVQNLPQSVRDQILDPPLFSYLLHGWMALGSSEFHLRFLSVIFSMLAALGMMLLARRASGWKAALIAGSIAALLPSQIRYAQEVGQYALMICLIAWSAVALQGWRNKGGLKWMVAWVALASATTYSYYGAALGVMIPYGIFMIERALKRDWNSLRTGFLALALYAVSIAPLLFYFLPVQLSRECIACKTSGLSGGFLSAVGGLWTATQELVAFQFTGWPWTVVPPWILPLLVALSLLLTLRMAKGERYLAFWLLGVWIGYIFADKLGWFPYGYRYGLILAPLLIPALAQGLATLFVGTRYPALAGSLILLIIFAAAIISVPIRSVRPGWHPQSTWAWPETEDLRPVVQHWLETRQPDEPTYVYYGAAPAFAYYRNELQASASNRVLDWSTRCWRETAPAYCRADNVFYGQGIRKLAPQAKVASIFNTFPARPAEFWLLFSHIYADEDRLILDGLSGDYAVAQSYRQNNAAAYLLKARP